MSNNKLDQQARLAALYEVSSRLGTTLDMEALLNLVIDSIIQLTGAERGYILLPQVANGEQRAMVGRNVDQQSIQQAEMGVSRTVIAQAMESGKGILTSNALLDDRFAAQESVVGYQLRSIMCAPLRARGRVIGAAYVDNRMFSGVFQEQDLELLEAFTNQAAMAIDNVRLFTQTDKALAKRVEELTLFQNIDHELNKSLNLRRVLGLALEWAVRLTDADGGSIGLIQTEKQRNGAETTGLRLLAHQGNIDLEALEVPLDHPVVSNALAQKSPVRSQDVSRRQAVDGSPAAAQLVVPILYEGEATGLIALESQNAAAFPDDDVAFVTRLADRAAVAIHNSRLYEAIAAANIAKSKFISLVTHELRLPITNIKGYTDLMAMVGSLSDQQMEFLEVVRRNIHRMNLLISDLADINHMQSGQMRFNMKMCELLAIARDVADSMNESITAKSQQLTLDTTNEAFMIYADPDRVAQILTNLVSNANKYTGEGGRIRISLSQNGESAQVSVADNGCGIKPEDQAKLFTQFFRSDDPFVREQVGWGLGLSIVKMMVEAQSGEINFESSYGQGSTFTFTLPLSREKPARKHE